jgi:hypothetical protein
MRDGLRGPHFSPTLRGTLPSEKPALVALLDEVRCLGDERLLEPERLRRL